MSNQIIPSSKRKVTLRLTEDLIQTTQDAVELGLAVSATAFIEDSIRARVREVRHARMRLLAAEAVADPDFMADMREVSVAFEPAQLDRWPAEESPLEIPAPSAKKAAA